MHSVKITDEAYLRVINLKHEIFKKTKKRIYHQDLLDYAARQLTDCLSCEKKFWEWVNKK